MSRIHIQLALPILVATLLATSAWGGSPRPIPPPRNFRPDHYVHGEFDQLLREHASRTKVHRKLAEGSITPHDIVGRKQFLALQHEVPPSERALILLDHWPHATFAGLIDDVRVLACFDSHDRLVAYELF